MTLLFRAGLVATILLAGSPAFAHHGWGGQEEAVTTLSGTVVQGVSLAGPHATMKIKVQRCLGRHLAPPAPPRAGLKRPVPIGDTVTVAAIATEPHYEMKTIYIARVRVSRLSRPRIACVSPPSSGFIIRELRLTSIR
jgi:hypothetical protein